MVTRICFGTSKEGEVMRKGYFTNYKGELIQLHAVSSGGIVSYSTMCIVADVYEIADSKFCLHNSVKLIEQLEKLGLIFNEVYDYRS